MKYGVLFSIAAALFAITAVAYRGWYLLLLWPALSFGMVAAGYLGVGPSVFGKSGGVLSTAATLLLSPYLLYSWSAWYMMRWFKREPAFDQIADRIFIGRRLLNDELPSNIDHVINLTSEFSEPERHRSLDYHSFQILDGFVPPTEQLKAWVNNAAQLPGTIYIHCAEGHGRTGLFAAALLVELGDFQHVEDALNHVKTQRPLVRLGKRQSAKLAEMQAVLAEVD